MGGSIPGAIEAKRLHPERHVVAVCGDGGFVMSITALFTAVSLQTPIVILVWEDNAYGLIEWKQEMQFNCHAYTKLDNPDLAKTAQAIGCYARMVKRAENFSCDLTWALANRDKPTVLVIPVDYSENMRLFRHLKGKIK